MTETEIEPDYRLDYRFHADAWAPVVADLTLLDDRGAPFQLFPPLKLVRMPIDVCKHMLATTSADSADLAAFRDQVNAILGNGKRRFFFKLSSRSAKDVYPMHVCSFAEVWTKCLESERVQEDVALHVNNDQRKTNDMFLALQPWREDRTLEYRCFVHRGSLLCMTDIGDGRWDAEQAYHLLGPNLSRLIEAVCRHPKLPQLTSCALDVYVWRDESDKLAAPGAVYLQEPNELDANLDTMGFSWAEVEALLV